jgi:hypothetical protein
LAEKTRKKVDHKEMRGRRGGEKSLTSLVQQVAKDVTVKREKKRGQPWPKSGTEVARD